MEHLSLEIFDLTGTGSKYAVLEPDASITITDTSEIFASGDVWSHSFTLNIPANAHIFGTAGDLHGSRLHEQVNKRRARLWVEGLPLYLGYLKLDDEVEVDADGNVDVGFESGQKTFEEMIEGTSATEVSVGDVVIGVALNRKRVVNFDRSASFTIDGLSAYEQKPEWDWLKGVSGCTFTYDVPRIVNPDGKTNTTTPYAQRWPKLVKSHGEVFDGSGHPLIQDYTNVQTPYDVGHPFCNINICYPFKAVNADSGEEEAGRGYTVRLAHGKPTVDGGDNQTRFNNAPNFYLLYFIDRLFKDMDIHILENQAKDVEDLRRVFMLNYGCHYEEIENDSAYFHSREHTTPNGLIERYGQYYFPLLDKDNGDVTKELRLVDYWIWAGRAIYADQNVQGKVLLRDVEVRKHTNDPNDNHLFTVGSVEGKAPYSQIINGVKYGFSADIVIDPIEERLRSYSAYLAYATSENYPNVEISEIIEAMKAMFGVRLLFSNDYSTVRIILLRNVFRSNEVQDIDCEIEDRDEKVENNKRGFRMTYGKGTDNTSFYYKGFADLFERASKTWKDTSDKHDYSQWELNANYDFIKQFVSAFNKTCYVTPVNGNAYGTQVDEDEDVLFPSLFELAGFMDAEDGDCTGEAETIEEIQCGAAPVLMNDVGATYALLFSGEMKAPSPENYQYAQEIATFGRAMMTSYDYDKPDKDSKFRVKGKFDLYISEGFHIRMEDNYAISNGGTPFDEADPGLCFGIMRSSGSDAGVRYFEDPDDQIGNDAWEVEPGSGAVSHPDTCNNHGNEWDYNGSMIVTPAEAPGKLEELFPDSDAPFNDPINGYITATTWFYANDSTGKRRVVLVASAYSLAGTTVTSSGDLRYWCQLTVEEIMDISRSGRHMVIELDSNQERGDTLVQLCRLAYGGGTEPMKIDDGVGSRYGRFSLKLRAEKLNPYYDQTQAEGSYNRRYLPISNENLRGRGLCDQFYKEYSYWVRNARIVKRTVHMELAQLLTIDKTKRVRVGDVTGFIRKMQYSVSNQKGLGEVTMEIMYI